MHQRRRTEKGWFIEYNTGALAPCCGDFRAAAEAQVCGERRFDIAVWRVRAGRGFAWQL